MEKPLETDDREVLQLSADLLGNTPHRTRHVVEVRGAELRLRREDGLPLWQTATARERASASSGPLARAKALDCRTGHCRATASTTDGILSSRHEHFSAMLRSGLARPQAGLRGGLRIAAARRRGEDHRAESGRALGSCHTPARRQRARLVERRCRGRIRSLRDQFELLDDVPEIFAHWLRLVTAFDVKGKEAHDARLVAVMRAHRIGHLLTFDMRDFASFTDIAVVYPTELAPS